MIENRQKPALGSPLLSRIAFCGSIAALSVIGVQAQSLSTRKTEAVVPKALLLRIVRVEDERRWDSDLQPLLTDKNASVRRRAALAAGRIGDDRAVEPLVALLQQDEDQNVRAMAAFALGEVESAKGAESLIAVLRIEQKEPAAVRARAVEALGKIVAALPKAEEAKGRPMREAILATLEFEAGRRSLPDTETILLGLTAALRAKPENSGKTIAKFLSYSDARIRADAANTMARLKLNDGNDQLRKLVMTDPDPVVRANAARVLGTTEDKAAVQLLLERALKDSDSRVRVSAIRSLTTLKDTGAASSLIARGESLLRTPESAAANETNELLEIATMAGRVFQATANVDAVSFLQRLRQRGTFAPEIETALARIAPALYVKNVIGSGRTIEEAQRIILTSWKSAASLAQGLREIASIPDTNPDKKTSAAEAETVLRAMLDYRNSKLVINTLVAVHSEYAIPDVLRALAAFKPKDLPSILLAQLKEPDVVVRGSAADLLGDSPPDDQYARALAEALTTTRGDKLNDAALSILDSLGKQKTNFANEAIRSMLTSDDYVVAQRAAALLKANGAGAAIDRLPIITHHTAADYERALRRLDQKVTATISTTRGSFTIELLTKDAPLNVDNFVQLAKRGYFNGITFHRVVPNFVIQGGDPRGDGNGGPGYQIRCEINEVPYDRGAVGMALSGKDTGGSQWFVTHSPQPHLDGGYTVFGRVVNGMTVVDNIARGDVIQSITISEK